MCVSDGGLMILMLFKLAWDATNGVYRLIFPNGTYYVETSTSGETLTSGVMPSAYLEGIGKVIITSPNSLGDTSEINQIIKFATSCGRVSSCYEY